MKKDFPDEVDRAARQFWLPHGVFLGRVEVTGITIDGTPVLKGQSQGKVRAIKDDAIHIERTTNGWVILVSLPDISLIPKDGVIDNEARQRLATRYEDRHISMLPFRISSMFSLEPNAPKPTVTIKMDLDNDFNLVSTNFFLSKLLSRGNYSYESATQQIDDGDPDLNDWYMLAHQLIRKRAERGIKTSYNQNTGHYRISATELLQTKRSEAAGWIIVQEIMMLTGQAVGQRFMRSNLPFIYLNASGGFEYSTEPKGFKPIGVPAYCHITSPLRRYVDAACIRNLVAHIRGQEAPYTIEELSKVADDQNQFRRETARTKARPQEVKKEPLKQHTPVVDSLHIISSMTRKLGLKLQWNIQTSNEQTSAAPKSSVTVSGPLLEQPVIAEVILRGNEGLIKTSLAKVLLLNAQIKALPADIPEARKDLKIEDFEPLAYLNNRLIIPTGLKFEQNATMHIGGNLNTIVKLSGEPLREPVTVSVFLKGAINDALNEAICALIKHKDVAPLISESEVTAHQSIAKTNLLETEQSANDALHKITTSNLNKPPHKTKITVEEFRDVGLIHPRLFKCRITITCETPEINVTAVAYGNAAKVAKSWAAKEVLENPDVTEFIQSNLVKKQDLKKWPDPLHYIHNLSLQQTWPNKVSYAYDKATHKSTVELPENYGGVTIAGFANNEKHPANISAAFMALVYIDLHIGREGIRKAEYNYPGLVPALEQMMGAVMKGDDSLFRHKDTLTRILASSTIDKHTKKISQGLERLDNPKLLSVCPIRA